MSDGNEEQVVAEELGMTQDAEASDEIALIADEDGIAVIGEPGAVERFLTTRDLRSSDLGLSRLAPTLAVAGSAVGAAGTIAAQSGRWVKLTEESARQLKTIGAMKGSAPDLVRGIVQGKNGQIKSIVEFSRGATALTSPAALMAIGTFMQQRAMQQQMDDIADYLAVIDEKVDDVLRAQKDAALADVIAIDLVIEEAMSIREQVGRVSEVTWSKVQATSLAVGRAQAYALRRIDALAEGLERKNELGDLKQAATLAEAAAAEWLAVLAHCFRLQEAIAVLELDRVLASAPEELEQHRQGLAIGRQNRRDMIQRGTGHLIDRMNAAAARANKRVLLNPLDSPAVVRASNRVASRVADFHTALGVGTADHAVDARRWVHAAGDLRDSVVEKGAQGVGLGKRLGGETRNRARSLTNRVASGIAERTASRQGEDQAD